MSNTLRIKIIDAYGTIILGVLGIILTIIITYSQIKASKEIENLRTQIAMNQLSITRSQMASSLMEPLIKGSESERIIAMILLESMGDKFASKIFEALALNDPDVKIRLQAIKSLGRKGGINIKPILAKIKSNSKSEVIHKAVELAEKDVVFREKLRIARIYFNMRKWEAAAQNYYEAAKFVDLSKIDNSASKIAESHYNHGGFEDAATKYNDIFLNFN